MTNTLKPLIHNMIESYFSEEPVFEMIEEIELEEAVNTFNDLPAAWKKLLPVNGATVVEAVKILRSKFLLLLKRLNRLRILFPP